MKNGQSSEMPVEREPTLYLCVFCTAAIERAEPRTADPDRALGFCPRCGEVRLGSRGGLVLAPPPSPPEEPAQLNRSALNPGWAARAPR